VNAWLLLVTTKPPSWADPMVAWVDRVLTVGEPHEGFFYPDPLGFWSEVRRWAVALLQPIEPAWDMTEALSVTTLLHMGDDVARLKTALDLCRPRLVLFLDNPAWEAGGDQLPITNRRGHHIPDPHREGQVYEGFWARGPDGITVGRSPQHPAAFKLYRADDVDGYLRLAPSPRLS
jgi:hypothetical protein